MPRVNATEGLPDPRWLVEQRARIQVLLLRLSEATGTMLARKRNRIERSIFMDLIGIGFSLWRSAFYAASTRSPENVDEAAKKFLHALVADNAIAYAQEKFSSQWTGGYYLNNALFRLVEIRSKYSRRLPATTRAGVFNRIDELYENGWDENDTQRSWEQVFALVSAICDELIPEPNAKEKIQIVVTRGRNRIR